jgi:hypothetical protein
LTKISVRPGEKSSKKENNKTNRQIGNDNFAWCLAIEKSDPVAV